LHLTLDDSLNSTKDYIADKYRQTSALHRSPYIASVYVWQYAKKILKLVHIADTKLTWPDLTWPVVTQFKRDVTSTYFVQIGYSHRQLGRNNQEY